MTALRSLVSDHDVTWIASAMSDEDRAVAAEAGGEAREETARDGSAYRLRLVAHDERAYETGPRFETTISLRRSSTRPRVADDASFAT